MKLFTDEIFNVASCNERKLTINLYCVQNVFLFHLTFESLLINMNNPFVKFTGICVSKLILENFHYQLFKYLLVSFSFYLLLGEFIASGNELRLVELQNKYPESGYVIKKVNVVVNVEMDANSQKPKITRQTHLEFLSLKNYCHVKSTFLHTNNSRLEKVNGKKFLETKGDVNEEMIFHSDLQFLSFTRLLKNKGEMASLEVVEKFKDFRFYAVEPFYFNVPVIDGTFTFNLDSSIHVDIHLFNIENLDIKCDSSFNQSERRYTYEYKIQHGTQVKNESDASSKRSNYPHVLVNIVDYTDANGNTQTVFKDADDLYHFYKSFASQTKNDTSQLRPVLDEIIAGVNLEDTTELVNHVFKWVQNKIRYIAFEYEMAGFIPESANKVVANKYGDCKGVANLTKTLLNMLGLDARLCWANATGDPYDYSIPSVVVDNHMICVWMKNDYPYYLDATATFNTYLYPPEKLQGRHVLVENGESYTIYVVPELNVNTNASQYNFNMELQNGTLIGNMESCFKGNRKALMLSFLHHSDATTNDLITGAIMNRTNAMDWDKNKTITVTDSALLFYSEVEMKHNVVTYENEVFIKMCPMHNLEASRKDTLRQSDIDLYLRNQITYHVCLKIPDNYTLKSTPNDTIIHSPIGEMKYTYTYENDTTVHFYRTYINRNLVLAKEDIPAWNRFVENVKNEDNNRIILTKLTN